MSEPHDPQAEALLDLVGRPRRRRNPRIARALEQGEHLMIEGVAAWRLGEGPAVLLAHGWEDDTSLWGPMIEGLRARGRAVVAFDLPAHGYSEGDRLEIETAAAAVCAVANGFGPISGAAGHSFGCKALAFAAAWNGFTPGRLALIGSPTAQRRQWARIVTHHGVDPAVAARALALREARLGFSIDRYDFAALAPAMTMPVLFVHSLDDEACNVADVQAVAASWPDAQMLIADGLGHRLIAQDPEIVAQVAHFLDP